MEFYDAVEREIEIFNKLIDLIYGDIISEEIIENTVVLSVRVWV